MHLQVIIVYRLGLSNIVRGGRLPWTIASQLVILKGIEV